MQVAPDPQVHTSWLQRLPLATFPQLLKFPVVKLYVKLYWSQLKHAHLKEQK